ncbi:hypothetical protein [Natrialba sp. PRR66]|uniref:hypothetical protein n=1 Tax=Natrialba sp. PRR66 TaxID=3098146 RepID=UPI002B1E795C|nr:hypothetical protein [Natrialba sp. PRR66]
MESIADYPLEFIFEYTTIDNRRRRMTIIPDTGGEAWRITHEHRDGEWRETGREPISGVTVQLSNHPTDLDDESTSGQPALPDGGQSHTNTQSADNLESQIDRRRTAARLEKLATAHEQIGWSTIPGISTVEAAAWAAKLCTAQNILKEQTDDSAVIDAGGASVSIHEPTPHTIQRGDDNA